MTEELLAGAVKAMQNAIHPLAYPQPLWALGATRMCDSLYDRMRDALTAATTTSGAPMQASKAPARIDVMTWLVDVDAAVASYPGVGATDDRLHQLYDHTWTPDMLDLVKAITRNCERWCEQAKDILGDNPVVVTLRQPCPKCGELWHYPANRELGRVFALRVSETGAQCLACKAKWVSDAEIAVFRRMLGLE